MYVDPIPHDEPPRIFDDCWRNTRFFRIAIKCLIVAWTGLAGALGLVAWSMYWR